MEKKLKIRTVFGREVWLVIFAFCGAVYMLFSKDYSPDKLLYGLDTYSIHLPFGLFAKHVLTMLHRLPVWMPGIFMGLPLIASSNLILFYPTNLIFLFLPFGLHSLYIVDIIIHMALAAFGMKLFLEKLKVDKPAALFSAFAYMLCGMFISYVYTGHWHDIKAMTMIPFVMYFLHKGINSGKAGDFLTTALFMALQVLAIGAQVMMYTYFLCAAYFVFVVFINPDKNKYNRIKLVLLAAAGTLMIMFFSAPQFFPAQDFLKYSWRADFSYADFISVSFHPAETLSLILPQAFGLSELTYWGYAARRAFTPYLGLVPVFLLFFAFSDRKKFFPAVFFTGMSVLFLFLSFGGYTVLYKLLYFIPVLNKLREPSRFLTIFSFTFIVSSAIGLNNLIKLSAARKKPKPVTPAEFRILSTVVLSLACILLFIFVNNNFLAGITAAAYSIIRGAVMPEQMKTQAVDMIHADIISYLLVAAAGCGLFFLKLFGRLKSNTVFICLLCALHFADARRIDSRFITYRSMDSIAGNDAVSDIFTNDRGIYRVFDLKYLWFPNRNLYYGKEFFAGYHGVIARRFSKMMSEEAFYDINVLRAFNVKYHMYDEDLDLQGLKKVHDGPIKVYEDPFVKPRIFFVDKVKKAADDREALAFLKNNFSPDTGILEENAPFMETAGLLKYSADIILYEPDRIKVNINTNKSGMAVLSNMYFPMWRVKTDGKESKLYNINYASMAACVAPGNHMLEFYYDMTFMNICLLLAVAAFLIYGFVLFMENRK